MAKIEDIGSKVAGQVGAAPGLGSSRSWDALAVHHAAQRTWTRETDGVELAILGRDVTSGATAMFQRTKRNAAQREERTHIHYVGCHTLVLEGEIEVVVGSDKRTLKAGDYFRCPPGLPHSSTVVSDSAELFVMTEGNPGLEFAPDFR
jgi:quercetin dioxygenase-like cupin family protein